MEITKGKIVALILAASLAITSLIRYGAFATMWVCLYLLVPLVFICFPDEVGSITGNIGRGYITRESPGWLLSIFGWIFLIGIGVLVLIGNQVKGH
jgi:hypothetical protein